MDPLNYRLEDTYLVILINIFINPNTPGYTSDTSTCIILPGVLCLPHLNSGLDKQFKIIRKRQLESDNTELSQFLFSSCFILNLFVLKMLIDAYLHVTITANSSLMNKRRKSERKPIGMALRALSHSFWDGHQTFTCYSSHSAIKAVLCHCQKLQQVPKDYSIG